MWLLYSSCRLCRHVCSGLFDEIWVTFLQGGHMTMACLSGKGHGKKKVKPWERGLKTGENRWKLVIFFLSKGTHIHTHKHDYLLNESANFLKSIPHIKMYLNNTFWIWVLFVLGLTTPSFAGSAHCIVYGIQSIYHFFFFISCIHSFI